MTTEPFDQMLSAHKASEYTTCVTNYNITTQVLIGSLLESELDDDDDDGDDDDDDHQTVTANSSQC